GCRKPIENPAGFQQVYYNRFFSFFTTRFASGSFFDRRSGSLFPCHLQTIILLATTVLSVGHYLFGNNHYLELLAHFRFEYLCLQIACLLGFIMLWRWKLALLTLLFLIPNAMLIFPYYLPQSRILSVGDAHIKIMHINVLGINRDYSAVAQAIQENKPEILVLEEYNERWRVALTKTGILKQFPYNYVVQYGNDGLYSRIPLKRVYSEYLQPSKDPTTIAKLNLNGNPVTMLVVHPRPPVWPSNALRNRNMFAKWTQDFKQYGQNVILVGDLNNTPWSSSFQNLLKQTGLRDSQLGFGIQPSWPIRGSRKASKELKLPFALLPIDHVLVSPNFVVLDRKLGPDVGSDHLPVIVELGLKRDE
ncbi:MAG TPA: endonuclease/exonuclease/phosphatase family protein, partial [Coleofasciculaceae cyanobacterium]